MSTLNAGDTVEGRYKIIREIDRGGMGTVFLAEHQLIKRRVALKLLRADLAEDPGVLDRFMNEARAAGTLGHPNIVESTDMGFTREGVPYIVFEFLEGSLLSSEIYRVHGLPVRRALRIARQIASALHAAHSAGIIHRDLKSDNVFLTDRDDAADHVKVIDFGISRFIAAEDDARNRAMVIGTPEFMAPEQITDPESVDGRADIYALGVILYEMLAARRPFPTDPDPDVVFRRIVDEAPPVLGVVDLPPGLEMMLMERFLAKRAEDRFESMRDVEGALAAFAGVVRPAGRDSAPIPIASAPFGSSETTITTSATNPVALPAAPKRASFGWLVAAVMAAGAGFALLTAEPGKAATDDATFVLHGDADKIAATVDSAVHAAQLRIDGLAQAPMLRAGIETDERTVRDMFKDDFKLQLNPGEVFELVQARGNDLVPMIRVPEGPALAPPADHEPHLHVGTHGLAALVTTPVTTQRGTAGGAIVLEVPIDLSAISKEIAAHATAATVQGLDSPVALVDGGAAARGSAAAIPVPFAKELNVTATLSATLPDKAKPARNLLYVRLACWILSGLLAIAYLANLLRARRQG
jgi:tRNA A-37 threonylcarbamoyl transferase component Bud32